MILHMKNQRGSLQLIAMKFGTMLIYKGKMILSQLDFSDWVILIEIKKSSLIGSELSKVKRVKRGEREEQLAVMSLFLYVGLPRTLLNFVIKMF